MSKKAVRVACLQMNSGPDVDDNLAYIAEAVRAAPGLDLLVLPENALQMPANRAGQYTEPAQIGHAQTELARLAVEHTLAIVIGSLAISDSEEAKPVARSILIDQQGKQAASYDKLHLFDVDTQSGAAHRYRESDTYRAGTLSIEQTSPKPLDIAGTAVQLGLTICYDLRFPELYRVLAERGAQIICVPAAFTYETGQAHWEVLLRSRAIENQVFIIAAAQTGIHASGRKTWGQSMIIDPWGDIVVQQSHDLGLVFADIDLTTIKSLAERFPVHQHRRLK